jgi:hypothetical protein
MTPGQKATIVALRYLYPYFRLMIPCMRCSSASHPWQAHRYTLACSATASPDCRIPVAKSRTGPSQRKQTDERLKVAIKTVHRQTRETYGVCRMQPELAAQGFLAERDRIGRLQQELGLRCKQKRKFKATTNSRHDLPVAQNLLGQVFMLTCPNEMWLTDITYLPTAEGDNSLSFPACQPDFKLLYQGQALAARRRALAQAPGK